MLKSINLMSILHLTISWVVLTKLGMPEGLAKKKTPSISYMFVMVKTLQPSEYGEDANSQLYGMK